MPPSNFQIEISRKILGKIPPRGVRPHIFGKGEVSPYGNVPANLHPYIAQTVACRRVLTFKKRNSSTFEATPPSPGGSGPKMFFAYFFLGQGHDSLNFKFEILQKKFVEKIPPGGMTPKFLKKWKYPPRVMCLQIFTQISLNCGLWTCAKIQKRNYRTFEATPPSQGGPGQKFFCLFFLVRAMTPLYFQIEILKKNFGKKFPQGGLTPTFWKSGCIP